MWHTWNTAHMKTDIVSTGSIGMGNGMLMPEDALHTYQRSEQGVGRHGQAVVNRSRAQQARAQSTQRPRGRALLPASGNCFFSRTQKYKEATLQSG